MDEYNPKEELLYQVNVRVNKEIKAAWNYLKGRGINVQTYIRPEVYKAILDAAARIKAQDEAS